MLPRIIRLWPRLFCIVDERKIAGLFSVTLDKSSHKRARERLRGWERERMYISGLIMQRNLLEDNFPATRAVIISQLPDRKTETGRREADGGRAKRRRSVARVAHRGRRQGKSAHLVSFYSAYHEIRQLFIKQCNRREGRESPREREREKGPPTRRWPVSPCGVAQR